MPHEITHHLQSAPMSNHTSLVVVVIIGRPVNVTGCGRCLKLDVGVAVHSLLDLLRNYLGGLRWKLSMDNLNVRLEVLDTCLKHFYRFIGIH